MASIPPCGLGCRIDKLHTFLKDNKKPFLFFSIFIVLTIEQMSLFIRDRKDYACFWYPLLTQVSLFLLVFSIFLWNEKLRFCFRKNLVIFLLSIYYFFGSIAILFRFTNLYYYEVVSILILVAAISIAVLSFFKKI